MSPLDHSLVVIYLIALYIITWFSMREKEVKSHTYLSEKKLAERHFLAGMNAGMVETVFSIVATEFSAVTFVQIPALVILGNKGIMWGLIGVVIGRIFISRFLLRNFYRSGLTVFDFLARGIKNYSDLSQSAKRAQRLMASIYFFSKVLSVSSALFLGLSFIAKFYNLPYYVILLSVITCTAIYTILGGLKVVMRTDVLQFWSIVLGGFALMLMAYKNISEHSFSQISTLASHAAFAFSDLSSILIGITAGFVSDFSTHGVEQEFVQKLKACRSPVLASKAVMFSTVLTIGLQALFICIGAVILMKTPSFSGEITDSINFFMNETIKSLDSGSRGLVVVAILAATMSSLDSSLNALSSVLWNDILPPARSTKYPVLIKIDNTVVVLFITLFTYFVGQNQMYIKGFFKLNYFTLLPLVCCFIIRFLCYPWMKFSFALHTVIFVIISCFLGWMINTVYFGFPSVISIFMCLLLSICSIQFYERLKRWI